MRHSIYFFYSAACFHYPECFGRCSRPEKSVSLFNLTVRFIWLPVTITSGRESASEEGKSANTTIHRVMSAAGGCSTTTNYCNGRQLHPWAAYEISSISNHFDQSGRCRRGKKKTLYWSLGKSQSLKRHCLTLSAMCCLHQEHVTPYNYFCPHTMC